MPPLPSGVASVLANYASPTYRLRPSMHSPCSGHSASFSDWRGGDIESTTEVNPMATKSHPHSTRQRARHVGAAVCRHWLVVLGARTVTTIVLMIVARWLHMPPPSDG